jgi:hypothetical protein
MRSLRLRFICAKISTIPKNANVCEKLSHYGKKSPAAAGLVKTIGLFVRLAKFSDHGEIFKRGDIAFHVSAGG